jgi:hypothetical protein
MPYALYRENDRISRPFVTEDELWTYARESSLCMEIIENEDMPPRPVLNPRYAIHACSAEGERLPDEQG